MGGGSDVEILSGGERGVSADALVNMLLWKCAETEFEFRMLDIFLALIHGI